MKKDILLNLVVSIFIQAFEDAADPNRYADTICFLGSEWCDFLLGYLSDDVREKYLNAIYERLDTIKPSSTQLWLLDNLRHPEDFKAILDKLKGVWRSEYFYPMYLAFCDNKGLKPISATQLASEAMPSIHNWYDNALSTKMKNFTQKTKNF